MGCFPSGYRHSFPFKDIASPDASQPFELWNCICHLCYRMNKARAVVNKERPIFFNSSGKKKLWMGAVLGVAALAFVVFLYRPFEMDSSGTGKSYLPRSDGPPEGPRRDAGAGKRKGAGETPKRNPINKKFSSPVHDSGPASKNRPALGPILDPQGLVVMPSLGAGYSLKVLLAHLQTHAPDRISAEASLFPPECEIYLLSLIHI